MILYEAFQKTCELDDARAALAKFSARQSEAVPRPPPCSIIQCNIYIYMFIYTYLSIYLSIYLSMYIYIYIYIYTCNPHLGLIHAPYFLFPSKRPFSLFIYYPKGQKYTGQDFINTLLRHGRYQLCHLGGHLGDHPFSLKARPPKK